MSGPGVPPWARVCGYGAIAAALPTVVWRVLLAAGARLGTPASWRRSESIPGSGAGYVVTLSVLQLVAALLTLVLIVPGADRVPRRSPWLAGRRLPRGLVVGAALTGAAVLAVLCVLSAVNWPRVDPFRDATSTGGWAYLCWACYAAAALWPLLLVPTVLGYRSTTASRPSGGQASVGP